MFSKSRLAAIFVTLLLTLTILPPTTAQEPPGWLFDKADLNGDWVQVGARNTFYFPDGEFFSLPPDIDTIVKVEWPLIEEAGLNGATFSCAGIEEILDREYCVVIGDDTTTYTPIDGTYDYLIGGSLVKADYVATTENVTAPFVFDPISPPVAHVIANGVGDHGIRATLVRVAPDGTEFIIARGTEYTTLQTTNYIVPDISIVGRNVASQPSTVSVKMDYVNGNVGGVVASELVRRSIQEGDRLEMRIGSSYYRSVGYAGPLSINPDESFVSFSANNVYINPWVEDNDGRVTDRFPNPETAGADERRMFLNVAVQDALGQNVFHRVNHELVPERVRTDVQDFAGRITVEPGHQRMEYTGLSNQTLLHRQMLIPSTSLPVGEYDIRIEGLGNAWIYSYPVDIGLGQFLFKPASGDDLDHVLQVGQETIFRTTIENQGTRTDTYLLDAVGATNGWTITPLASQVTVSPGTSEEVEFRATPATDSVVGEFRTFTLRAQSFSSSEIRTLPAVATVTGAVVPLTGDRIDIAFEPNFTDIGPGGSILAELRVTNRAFVEDTVLLSGSLLPLGWKADFIPSFLTIPADSSEMVTVRLEAPTDATPLGQPFTATATRLQDGAAQYTDDLLIRLREVDRVSVRNVLRDADDSPSDLLVRMAYYQFAEVPFLTSPTLDVDEDFAPSAAYELINMGTRRDTYTAQFTLSNGRDCDSNNGYQGPRVTQAVQQITLEPGERGVVWTDVDVHFDCYDNEVLGKLGEVNIHVTSENDESIRQRESVVMTMVGQGDKVSSDYQFTTSSSRVFVDVIQEGMLSVAPGGELTFRVDAFNGGADTDRIQLVTPDSSGNVEFDLEFVEHLNVGTIGDIDGLGGRARSTSASACSNLVCTLGVGEGVSYALTIKVSPNAPSGELIQFPMTVRSLDSQITNVPVAHSDVVSVNIADPYAFRLTAPVTTLMGHAGELVGYTVELENQGGSLDGYDVSVSGLPAGTNAFFVPTSPLVPARETGTGVLLVELGDDVPVGNIPFSATFTSQGNTAVSRAQGFNLNVIERGPELVEAMPATLTLAPEFRTSGDLIGTVRYVVEQNGGTSAAQWAIDQALIPDGWTVTPSSGDVVYNNGRFIQSVEIRAPADTVSGSHGSLLFKIDDDVYSYSLVNALSAQAGIVLDGPADDVLVAIGGATEVEFTVTNADVLSDNIDLDVLAAPEGWGILFEQPRLTVAGKEIGESRLRVLVPGDEELGVTRSVLLQATSVRDPSQTDLLQLQFTTGESLVELTLEAVERLVGPQDLLTVNVGIENIGLLRDTYTLRLGPNDVDASLLTPDFSPSQHDLLSGETGQSLLTFTVPDDFDSTSVISIPVEAVSGEGNVVRGAGEFVFELLPYRAVDVDGDGRMEYAVDRDGDLTPGFESFEENLSGEGVQTVALVPEDSFSDDALASYIVTVTEEVDNETVEYQFLDYMLDLDGDGKVDFLLDMEGNGLATHVYDPDQDIVNAIDLQRDVDGDGFLDLFINTDDDAFYEAVYNPVTGEVYNLILEDANNDDFLDYVVDTNGNEEIDEGEVVLLGGQDRIIGITERLDVDGDGKLDVLVDDDADGQPDYFLSNGRGDPIAIELRDVTDDGVKDWTFDSDGNGRTDSYYDPVTKQSGDIDEANAFLQGLLDYWYIGLLLGMVLILFGVLLAVTRK